MQYRTHHVKQLLQAEINKPVTVAGFLDTKRDHGGLLFITIRDSTGIIQCVLEQSTPLFETANALSKESVVSLTGVLKQRVSGTINPNLELGAFEIECTDIKILSIAQMLPFDQQQTINDELKLKYRYLYLRREKMQKKLKLRADFIQYLRNQMIELGFMEVQTPILTASSPEGARDYLVPSYDYKGKFYALPQAPQQFKQILMASGVNKYYQIAPCFRAENSRADRSPGEFYQLDFEISFGTQEQVFDVCEQVIGGAFEKFFAGKINKTPFPIFTYQQAMEEFCCDKPDLRNPLRYQNITSVILNNTPAILEQHAKQSDFCAKILPVVGKFTRKMFDQLQLYAQECGLSGMAYAKFETKHDDTAINSNETTNNGVWSGPGAKMIPNEYLTLDQDGAVFLLAGSEKIVNKAGANLRNYIYNELLGNVFAECMEFCWVNDYPMFEKDDTTGQIVFSHNPFSMPQKGVQDLYTSNPLDIVAYQYDLVCNGVEICSGAVRNHDPNGLRKAFEIAGYNISEINQNFNAMLSAFECGVPPHAGAAPGIDRMLMLISGEDNIREVIAFPLSQNAQDLLMGAPTHLSDKQMKDLGLKVIG